jgi:hypothetical protein
MKFFFLHYDILGRFIVRAERELLRIFIVLTSPRQRRGFVRTLRVVIRNLRQADFIKNTRKEERKNIFVVFLAQVNEKKPVK